MNTQILILGLLFIAVTGGMLSLSLWLNRRAAVSARLQKLDRPENSLEDAGREWLAKVAQVASPAAKLAAPKEGWEASSLRVRFMQAGLRDASWVAVFFASKTVLALALPGLFAVLQSAATKPMSTNMYVFVLLVLATIGYYLPNLVLGMLTQRRRQELTEALPDAIDLMMVCVEAGLGLDAAMNRAASEIGLRSPALADELTLVALELRMSVKREQALRNLALRTGVDDIASFVAMLAQADRFGTNIAQALKVQADTMRVQRTLRAEERAAKIPLKLLFPLIFFIFPSLMLVLMGPAMISIYRVLLPTMAGNS